MAAGALSGKDVSIRPGKVTVTRCSTSPSSPGASAAEDFVPCDDDILEEELRNDPLSLAETGGFGSTYEHWESDWDMRPGSGRFSPEEMVCFRRVAKPSPTCRGKAQLYWQTTGDEKRQLSEQCWHSLPVLKGKFYAQYYNQERLPDPFANNAPAPPPKKKESTVPLLPEEALTGMVLEEIFPKTPQLGRKSGSEAMSAEQREALLMQRRSTGAGPDLHKIFKDDKRDKQVVNLPKTLMKRSSTAERKPVTVSKGPIFSSGTNGTATSSQGGAAANTANAEEMSGICAVISFRKRLIEKFHVLKDAFDAFTEELPGSKSMTKKEFRRILLRLGLDIVKDEREVIFRHLDLDGDSHVSMRELMMAVEAAAPVKSIPDLRRRWLATGFRSMNQAFFSMQERVGQGNALAENGLAEKRMNLREFGETLSYVYVTEQSEHAALFNIIRDPCDKQGKVSISELASAVATVSPGFLLEDLRARCIKKYSNQPDSQKQHSAGFMVRAFQDLQGNSRSNLCSGVDFVSQAVRRLGFTELEALKAFRNIDVDNMGKISKQDFFAALSLCEPSCFLEDVRRKIRQRFRSIHEALTPEVVSMNTDGDQGGRKRLSLERFNELLLPLELTEAEVKKVFNLIDVEFEEALSAVNFLRGTRVFAPSSVIEDLRLQCLYRHRWIYEAFKDVDIERSAPLNREEFSQMLTDVKLSEWTDVDAIFDILDVNNVGSTSLGNLVAALQAGGPGSSVKLQEEGLRAHAKQDVRKCISSAHTLVGDLKTQVRQGVRWPGRQPDAWPIISEVDMASEVPAVSRQTTAVGSKRGKQRSRPATGMRSSQAAPSATLDGCEPQADRASSRPATSSLPQADSASSRPATSLGDTGSSLADSGKDLGLAGLHSRSGHQPRLRTFPHQELKSYVRVQTPSEQRRPGTTGRAMSTSAGTPSHRCVKDNQNSWGNLWRHFKRCTGQEDRETLEKDLQAYYQNATYRLSHDVPILQQSHSRFALHQKSRAHYQKIASLSRRNQAE